MSGFVLGFTLVFVSLGATATLLGQFLSDYEVVFMRISGVFIILLGLAFFPFAYLVWGDARVAAVVSLAIAYVLLPRTGAQATWPALPAWDLPLRMALTPGRTKTRRVHRRAIARIELKKHR